MTKIVSLDPGGTTGYAVYHRDGTEQERFNRYGGTWTWGHLGPDDHHEDLFALLCLNYTKDMIVVCESFEFRQNRQRDNINLMSREYIGVAKLFGQREDTPVVFQSAAQGKGFVSDEKLKVMGLYIPGKKHAMDAMRHLVFYMVNKQRRHDLIESWKTL
jgi:hypothetical protein